MCVCTLCFLLGSRATYHSPAHTYGFVTYVRSGLHMNHLMLLRGTTCRSARAIARKGPRKTRTFVQVPPTTMTPCDTTAAMRLWCQLQALPDGILNNLVTMINFMKEGEFVRANDIYILTAIGNAPWPIGLTMVGIHERSGTKVDRCLFCWRCQSDVKNV